MPPRYFLENMQSFPPRVWDGSVMQLSPRLCSKLCESECIVAQSEVAV